MSVSVFPIKAFNDNYIWCLHNKTHCTVVDPGDAAPVLAYCQDNQLILSAIIITHHHWDHTGGIDALLAAFPNIPVYGPQNKNIEQITVRLSQGDAIEVAQLGVKFSVIEVPGHTLDHIAYYGDIGLFCGDTLFSAGCGRLFEGTPQQMYQSLAKLTALPADTAVFCTHEYTMANIAFAETVEPNNQALIDYKQWANKQREKNAPTLPSNIQRELAVNPFLRCHSPELVTNVSQNMAATLASEQATFASLRSWKDNF
ncbi:hydroxyacylglutathione hydrolase [Paraglaciecola sp. MB-3u-78]|uniref:hydroxyacylglutathione hydrolase n=1 Tax=Paraglaciecola sp. MB-3u-78 TaxID=2058332 RepID=UPI000C33D667|nr:hydroxyacylglutathione hydrolase [Paraglaciecola sp. MB-3u-78]PKG97521.1 hydroxyacylglutathione hydrolase [Paraglaciecola sp. MB-3u-78]